jgi:tryptophan synthase beta chain
VGGGSNAIGLFHAFLADREVELVGVEAGGEGLASGRHAARFHSGREGVLHGTRTLILQDAHGQVSPTHSVSAGLDYPAVGPEHAMLAATGRARYATASDEEALAALAELARLEGIIPALESAHAVAHARRLAAGRPDALIVVNLSGRGDKDMEIARRHLDLG